MASCYPEVNNQFRRWFTGRSRTRRSKRNKSREMREASGDPSEGHVRHDQVASRLRFLTVKRSFCPLRFGVRADLSCEPFSMLGLIFDWFVGKEMGWKCFRCICTMWKDAIFFKFGWDQYLKIDTDRSIFLRKIFVLSGVCNNILMKHVSLRFN